MQKRDRLPPETFDTPVQKIRRGYYSAVYFWREKQILEKMPYLNKALMQVFQKNDAVLCGSDEAIAVLKLCSGFYKSPEQAYRLFDEYKELERLVRQSHIARDYKKLQRALEEKIKFEIELDELWQNKFTDLEVLSLCDGERIEPWETVMTISGHPQHFAHLESIYL